MTRIVIGCAWLALVSVGTWASLDYAYEAGMQRGYELGLVVGDFRSKASAGCKVNLRPSLPALPVWPRQARAFPR